MNTTAMPDSLAKNDPPNEVAGAKCFAPVTITLTPLPPRSGEPPPEVRLRQLLKIALRGFRFRAAWTPAAMDEPKALAPTKEK